MKHIVGSALALLFSLIQARSIIKQTTITLPSNNLISNKFSSWLSAFNTADEATILSFYSTNVSEASSTSDEDICWAKGLVSPTQLARMANWTGGFEPVDLEFNPNDDTEITVLLQEKGPDVRKGYFRASMAIDDEKPGQPITKLDLFPVATPLKMIPLDDPRREVYEKGMQPLTTSLREKLIHAIAKVLREQYVYPQQAEEMIAVLEKNLENGEYDALTDSNDFSYRLQADLKKSSNEISERSVYTYYHEPFPLPEKSITAEDEEENKTEMQKHLESNSYGFGNVSFDTKALPGKTIATLAISGLFQLELVLDTAREKMNRVSEADVLILDLRNCFGISADTAAFVLSYLFDTRWKLTSEVDREGKVRSTSSTMSTEEMSAMGIMKENRFGIWKPVYVLTNEWTTRDAELIAYTIQQSGRGVVVGEQETTGGWAESWGESVDLLEEVFGDGWWTMYVRTVRLVHEVTGSNWDVTGVKSDIVVNETVEEEHCRHKARLAAIEYEKKKEIERAQWQDELKV